MLKDDIKYINKRKQEELERKQDFWNRFASRVKSTKLYKAYIALQERKEARALAKYDRKTERFIKKLPAKLKRRARGSDTYTDIYVYQYYFLASPYLYSNLASLYANRDRRAVAIMEYLDEQGIKYTLATHNYTIESYFTIRVHF
jgi:hypothetical protein